jgi:hypothetical protein
LAHSAHESMINRNPTASTNDSKITAAHESAAAFQIRR